MKNQKLRLIPSKSPSNWIFKTALIVGFIGFLLMWKPVAEIVKKGVDMVAPSLFPAVEIVQEVGASLLFVGVGLALLLLSPIFFTILLKTIVIVIGVVVIGWGLSRLYNTIFRGKTENIVPKNIRDFNLKG